jgi:hypothetical protein
LHQVQRRILELAAVTPAYQDLARIYHWPHVHNIWRAHTIEPGWYEYVWLDQ